VLVPPTFKGTRERGQRTRTSADEAGKTLKKGEGKVFFVLRGLSSRKGGRGETNSILHVWEGRFWNMREVLNLESCENPKLLHREGTSGRAEKKRNST